MNTPTINVRLDKRKIQKSGIHKGKYPIKIFVTYRVIREGKLVYDQQPYPTKYYATAKDYQQIFSVKKPKATELLEIREAVGELERKANDVIDRYKVTTQSDFELYFLPGKRIESITGQFKVKIDVLRNRGQISTAEKYQTALSSLLEFGGEHLTFNEITPEFLCRYQEWYLKPRKSKDKRSKQKDITRSTTSLAINLRHLRSIMNTAIKRKIISEDLYPFGADEEKYSIPDTQSEVKKFLLPDEKDRFLEYEPKDPEVAEGKDYSLFCYFSNGINLADIANLRKLAIQKDYFIVERTKTKGKLKKIKRIVVPLRSEHREIIKRRGKKSLIPNDYVFPILNDQMSAEDKFKAVRRFVRYTNDALAVIQKDLGFDTKLTTYTLRHTFSFMILHQGGSTEILQDALGHGSKQTTEAYKHGFTMDVKKKYSEGL
jgi:integrase